jgi:hypothetical protein
MKLQHAKPAEGRDGCAHVQYVKCIALAQCSTPCLMQTLVALPPAPVQAEAELDALRSELQQQQADLARRAASLAAAAKEGAAQVGLPSRAGSCGWCALSQLCASSHMLSMVLPD